MIDISISTLKILPTDYKSHGGTVDRWTDDKLTYPDCSCGCRWWIPLHDKTTGEADTDWGVCSKQDGPRAGLLTFEHQAGFHCYQAEIVEPPGPSVYTVTCDYSATGEGRTLMVLYTRGHPRGPNYDDPTKDGRYWALENFKEKFGDWFTMGAKVHDGMIFDFPGSEHLLSDVLKKSLQDWEKTAGGLEYHACLHFNFS